MNFKKEVVEMKKYGWLFAFTLLLNVILSFSCRQSFLIEPVPPEIETPQKTPRGVVDVRPVKVDILWVIDNTPSMGIYQDKVKENARDFIEALSDSSEIDWKMGLISTSVYNAAVQPSFNGEVEGEPYLGFETPFDFTHPIPSIAFREAVSLLGLSGNVIERSFYPVLNTLRRYPNFLRDDAFFVLFIVTDAPEQSVVPHQFVVSNYNDKVSMGTRFRYVVTPEDFMDQIDRLKGSRERTAIYGAFAFKDFGCRPSVENASYQGSRYQKVIRASGGVAFSACAEDFGEKFVQIVEDIKRKILASDIISK